MDTMLQNGDLALCERGFPITVTGVQEHAQRLLLRLSTQKGAFALDPSFGSELHRLRGSNLSREAERLVAQAAAQIPGVTVQTVTCTQAEQGAVRLDIHLVAAGENATLGLLI